MYEQELFVDSTSSVGGKCLTPSKAQTEFLLIQAGESDFTMQRKPSLWACTDKPELPNSCFQTSCLFTSWGIWGLSKSCKNIETNINISANCSAHQTNVNPAFEAQMSLWESWQTCLSKSSESGNKHHYQNCCTPAGLYVIPALFKCFTAAVWSTSMQFRLLQTYCHQS